jgi:S1-C subfamily serine protease
MDVPDDKIPAATLAIDKDTASDSAPVIEFLSGRHRGTHQQISEQTVFLTINELGGISIVPASESVEGENYPIRLHRSGDTYELEVQPLFNVWVNGKNVSQHTLQSGELLEIGRNGPMLRYRIYPVGEVPLRTAANAFNDCIDCARYSDGSFARRTRRLVSEFISELVVRTTVWFRILVVALLAILVISTVYLSRQSQYLEERLTAETSFTQGISELLQRTERKAITSEDLANLRAQLEKRVDALEARSVASRKIIAAASKSIVFVQGSYSYFDEESNRPLRYVGLDSTGEPYATAEGPAVTLDGDGPIVELQYTGTAFVIGAQDLLITNRHVAVPWENNPAHELFAAMGLVPKFERFIGYLPGVEKPFDVQLIAASDDADIAVLRCAAAPSGVRLLVTGSNPVHPGDEVIVMGYPTGVRAMLARTDTKFLDEIREAGNLDFWVVVERLSAASLITPLASRGIVGQVTPDAVVYDAETTRGGSGGPVLNMRGEVIAINTAIMPEFGGSNIGVPMARITPVLNQALELIKSQ